MAVGVQVWSQTPSLNATSDSQINFAEGQAPSSLNDSCRAMMSSVARWTNDNNGTLVTGGTSAAYTVTSNQVEAALTAGYTIKVQFNVANSAGATLAVDGLAATPLQLVPGTNATTGVFQAGSIWCFTYSSTGTGQWVAHSPPTQGAFAVPVGTVVTASLVSSVTMSTATYTDGPSVTASSSGVWFATATFSAECTTGITPSYYRLWDGSTGNIVAAAEMWCGNSSPFIANGSISGIVTSPTGNIRVSGIVGLSGSAGFRAGSAASSGTTGQFSTITAVRMG